ncbi:MAG: hypothetical protein JRF33_21115 [Deltaproteobacteria bacterium]|nr:hypothetical protein [Deltaproteobacteria bacterium]
MKKTGNEKIVNERLAFDRVAPSLDVDFKFKFNRYFFGFFVGLGVLFIVTAAEAYFGGRSLFAIILRAFLASAYLIQALVYWRRSHYPYISFRGGLAYIRRGLFKTGTLQSNVEFRLDQILSVDDQETLLMLEIEGTDPIGLSLRLVRPSERGFLKSLLHSNLPREDV